MTDIDDLRAELASLRDEVTELRAERDQRMTRRKLLTGGAFAAVATGMGAAPAGAADGDPVLAGQETVITTGTRLTDVASTAVAPRGVLEAMLADPDPDHNEGLFYGAVFASAGGDGLLAVGKETGAVLEGKLWGSRVLSDFIGVTVESKSIGITVEAPYPLVLAPVAGLEGPPTEYGETGVFVVDERGDLWLCASPSVSYTEPQPEDPESLPRIWTRLNDQGPVFLDPAARAVDTRQTGGIIAAGETRAISLAVDGMPEQCAGALVNVTVTGTGRSGHLTLWNADGAEPATSTLNWTAAGTTLANGTAVALGPSRTVNVRASFSAAHVVVDVIAGFPGVSRVITP